MWDRRTLDIATYLVAAHQRRLLITQVRQRCQPARVQTCLVRVCGRAMGRVQTLGVLSGWLRCRADPPPQLRECGSDAEHPAAAVLVAPPPRIDKLHAWLPRPAPPRPTCLG